MPRTNASTRAALASISCRTLSLSFNTLEDFSHRRRAVPQATLWNLGKRSRFLEVVEKTLQRRTPCQKPKDLDHPIPATEIGKHMSVDQSDVGGMTELSTTDHKAPAVLDLWVRTKMLIQRPPLAASLVAAALRIRASGKLCPSLQRFVIAWNLPPTHLPESQPASQKSGEQLRAMVALRTSHVQLARMTN